MLEPLLRPTWTRAGCRDRADVLRDRAGVRQVLDALVAASVVSVYDGGERAGLRDRPGPAPGRGVLPQRRHPPLPQPRDRSWRCSPATSQPEGDRRTRLGRGAAAARPAEVRVLLPATRRATPGARRRAQAAAAPAGNGRPTGAPAGRGPGAAGASGVLRSVPRRAVRRRRPAAAHAPGQPVDGRRGSSTSASASGARCCCRGGCTAPTRSRASCSPRR